MKKRNKIKLKILSFLSLLSICLMTLFSAKTFAFSDVVIDEPRNFLSEDNSDYNISLYPLIDNENYYTWYSFDMDAEDAHGILGSVYFYINTQYRIANNNPVYDFLNCGVYFTDEYYSNAFDIYNACNNWINIEHLRDYMSSRRLIQYIYSETVLNYFYIIFEYRKPISDGFIDFTTSDFPYTDSFGLGFYDYENSDDALRDEILTLNGQIGSLQSTISRLNSIISQQASDISTLEGLIVSYQQQLQDAREYNAPQLIWTIASTPFESFKQIWNVDLLGLNIANFAIGMLGALIFIYILKKVL